MKIRFRENPRYLEEHGVKSNHSSPLDCLQPRTSAEPRNVGAGAFSLLSPAQCAGAIGGFLAYKAPLLARQLGKAIAEYGKPEAQAPLGMGGGLPTGSLGIALQMAQERRAARS